MVGFACLELGVRLVDFYYLTRLPRDGTHWAAVAVLEPDADRGLSLGVALISASLGGSLDLDLRRNRLNFSRTPWRKPSCRAADEGDSGIASVAGVVTHVSVSTSRQALADKTLGGRGEGAVEVDVGKMYVCSRQPTKSRNRAFDSHRDGGTADR